MLTEEQARLVAEGMFRDSTAVGSRIITDSSGSKAVIVRVKAFTNRGKVSKRILFFGEAEPKEITTPQKDRLVILASTGVLLNIAIDMVVNETFTPMRPFGSCDANVDALLWARS